jgi:transcriptional regulator with XRE-family HTH domain
MCPVGHFFKNNPYTKKEWSLPEIRCEVFMVNERFAGRLAELRTAAGLTQQQLADQAGLTRDGVAKLEGGSRAPSWETVLAICSALSVSCEAFRTAPTDAAKKGPGRPKKASADAAGANVEGTADDAPQRKPGAAKKGRKTKGK